jgi:hypothetical protein
VPEEKGRVVHPVYIGRVKLISRCSVAGKWTDHEAPRLALYYLGYYRADRAQLLREPDAGSGAATLIAEIYAPEGPAAGITILW